jgi:hypothetical protein
MRMLFSTRIIASSALRFIVLMWLPLPLTWWLCTIVEREAREVGNRGRRGDELGNWEARAESNAATARRWETYKGQCGLRDRPALSAASGTGAPLKTRRPTNCLISINVDPSGTVAGKRAIIVR